MTMNDAPGSLRKEKIPVAAEDGVPVDVWRSYQTDRAGPGSPAVVLCHGFVQNHRAFGCRARSLEGYLRSLGFVVYVVDLRGRDGRHVARGLVDYIERDAPAVLSCVRAEHRAVAWVGHSMGGLIGALLRPDVAEELSAVVAVGSPLLPGRPGLHVAPVTHAAVRAARLLHTRGTPFGGRVWGKSLSRMRAVLDDPGVPSPLRVWAPRTLEDESLTYALQESFADDSWAVFADLIELLVSKAQRAGDILVNERLAAHRRPFLVVAGDADDLAPPAGVELLVSRSGAPWKNFITVGHARDVRVGHIDLLIGQAAPRLVWAPVVEFLRTHLGHEGQAGRIPS